MDASDVFRIEKLFNVKPACFGIFIPYITANSTNELHRWMDARSYGRAFLRAIDAGVIAERSRADGHLSRRF